MIQEDDQHMAFGIHMSLIAEIITYEWEYSFFKKPKSITFVDKRDERDYRAVQIGQQIWMAENLNYEPEVDSWCYESENNNCETFGRLYTYDAAMNACPEGWHLPDEQEWLELTTYLGENAGGKLKAKKYWTLPNVDATDESSFSALPAGIRKKNGKFSNMGNYGFYWTATPQGSKKAKSVSLYGNSGKAFPTIWKKAQGQSVRCIRD
jgi:uncharacterized protein (TIGR02145 family)